MPASTISCWCGGPALLDSVISQSSGCRSYSPRSTCICALRFPGKEGDQLERELVHEESLLLPLPYRPLLICSEEVRQRHPRMHSKVPAPLGVVYQQSPRREGV